MAYRSGACQHQLSTGRIVYEPVNAATCLVPEGVKNLNPCSFEILGVACDNRQAVHFGRSSDQPVYDWKRLRVLLTPPRGGDWQRDRQDPVRESELQLPQPALKARRLLTVTAATN